VEALGKFGINGWMLLFQIVHFLILAYILNRLLYKPVVNAFEKRKAKIADALAEAARVKTAADEERAAFEAKLSAERHESQTRLREAVARSEEAAERRLKEATVEAEQIVARARAEADETRKHALAGLEGDIADLALVAAGRVLGEAVDEQRHRKLVDGFIKDQLGELS
jgi:F-type H+-transporting ATPase subunit b